MSENKSPIGGYAPDTDARSQAPTFDEMVAMIEKLFKDYLKDIRKNALTDEQIEEGWQRYKTLNHLYQDEQPKPAGAVWVPCSQMPKDDSLEDYPRKYILCGHNDGRRGYVDIHHVTYEEMKHVIQAYDWCEWLNESGTASNNEISEDAHEKEVMMQAFAKVVELFEKREWIMQGRGLYPYNDDRYKEEVRYLYDEFEAIRKDTWANIKSKSFEYRQKIIEQYLKYNPSNKDAIENEQEQKKAKAWDDWKDSLVTHDNVFVHYKTKDEHYTEDFTLEEFKKVMIEKSPVFIFCNEWSSKTPHFQITTRVMPVTGFYYFCNAWADKTPVHTTIEEFYKKLQQPGLKYFSF